MPKMDPTHYSRHQELIPLEAMRGQHMLLLGCGSMGTLIARLLARLGIVHFHLIDPAAVTPAHLNRAAFSEDQVGQNKAAALSSVLARIHKSVRCITTAKPFQPDHLTQGRESAVIITTSDPKLPPRVTGALSMWPKAERPVVLVARHAGLTGGYWMTDLARDEGEDAEWRDDVSWLSIKDPPDPKSESRIVTTAHYAAAIATQALVDHLVSRQSAGGSVTRVKRRVDFDLGAVVHEPQETS